MSSATSQSSPVAPQRKSSSRKSSHTEQTNSSLSKSTSSIDSQTVLLNESTVSETPADSSHFNPQQSRPSAPEEPRKCWICFSDETEDTPASSRWRSPCPCALTAHESCLLDWVADLEAPTSRRRSGASPKIKCPQCKNNIVIARPRNYLVEGFKVVDRFASKLVVPGLILTVAGSLYTGATLHGASSVYFIFGRKDFEMMIQNPESISAKWLAGFPLIPFILVFSRTTLVDGALPALPILFFASQIPASRNNSLPTESLWPPSAAMTFAVIPYLRGAYNEVYRRLFSEREQRWLKQVQPRAGEAGDDEAEQLGDVEDGHEEGGLAFDWNLEVEIVEEVVEEDPLPPPQAAEPAGGEEGDGAQARNGQPNNGAQQQNQRANQQQAGNRPHPLVVTTSRVGEVVMGALCFPAIASLMGEILKLGLPRSWTQTQWVRRPGILHTKWGRSIVGGCLFIVMKDTLVLYSRYRTARDHRMRRVMNYDKEQGKNVD